MRRVEFLHSLAVTAALEPPNLCSVRYSLAKPVQQENPPVLPLFPRVSDEKPETVVS